MGRYLFVIGSGEVVNGALKDTHSLMTALSDQHDVTLMTLGDTEAYDERKITKIELHDRDLPAGTVREIEDGNEQFFDKLQARFSAHLELRSPAEIGLPTDPAGYDAIYSHQDVTGWTAIELRDRYYPNAALASFVTIDPEPICVADGLPELGRRRAEDSGKIFAKSDVLITQGGKSTNDAVRLTTAVAPDKPLPPINEFIPGFETPTEAPRPWTPNSGEPLELIMLGRMHDENKGAHEAVHALAAAVAEGYDIRLTLQGITPEDALEERYTADLKATVQELGLTDRVTLNEFTRDSTEVDRAVAASNAQVMLSESESYGQAAHEYAITGRPVIVAKGVGNGFAELLSDPNRMDAGVADLFVMDDAGTHSLRGTVMGSVEATGQPRHTVVADRMMHMYDHFDEYQEAGHVVRERLSHYTPTDSVAYVERAMATAAAGTARHSVQGPDGRELPAAHPALVGTQDNAGHTAPALDGPTLGPGEAPTTIPPVPSAPQRDQGPKRGLPPGTPHGVGDALERRSKGPGSEPQRRRTEPTQPRLAPESRPKRGGPSTGK